MTDPNRSTTIDSQSSIAQILRRQYRLLMSSFAVLFGLVIAYVLSQPTLYETKGTVLVGERFFFMQLPQTATGQVGLMAFIESPEQIKYRFPNVTITPIKNTRVIEILSKRETATNAQADVQQSIDTILIDHEKVLQDKRSEFLKFLETSQISKKESLTLIDVATTSSSSKQYTPIKTWPFPTRAVSSKGWALVFSPVHFYRGPSH